MGRRFLWLIGAVLACLALGCRPAPAPTPAPTWACGPDPGLGPVSMDPLPPALTDLADGTFLTAVRSDSRSGGTVMASGDGLDWLPASEPADAPDGVVTDMARIGGVVVAVGSSEVPSLALAFPEPPTYVAMSWALSGSAWTAAPARPTEEADELRAVTATTRGFVAMPYWGARVLLSQDGLTWSDMVVLDPGEVSEVRDVAGIDGQLIAVGNDGDRAAAWTSTDGQTWARARIADAPGGFESVAAAGGVLLASGGTRMDETLDGRWLSRDSGRTWTLVSADGDQAPDPSALLFGRGGGFVAAGATRFDRDAIEVWESTDGVTWTRSGHPAPAGTFPGELVPRSIAAWGGRIVIAATTGEQVMPRAIGYCSGPLPSALATR